MCQENVLLTLPVKLNLAILFVFSLIYQACCCCNSKTHEFGQSARLWRNTEAAHVVYTASHHRPLHLVTTDKINPAAQLPTTQSQPDSKRRSNPKMSIDRRGTSSHLTSPVATASQWPSSACLAVIIVTNQMFDWQSSPAACNGPAAGAGERPFSKGREGI